jgi:SAM-dependent methyltransferase
VVTAHPAPYTASILERAAPHLDGLTVLDCFAGVGRVHRLGERLFERPAWTVGVELEWEWVVHGEGRTLRGDATGLPFRCGAFDACFTSCTYGNRMADTYTDDSERHTYTAALGRPLSSGNSGAMQFGPGYKRLHERAWREVCRVVKPGGLFLLNISDHIRKGEVVEVCRWHQVTLEGVGFELKDIEQVATPRQRHGENGDARVGFEELQVWVRP